VTSPECTVASGEDTPAGNTAADVLTDDSANIDATLRRYTPHVFNSPDRCSPGTISVKFYLDVNIWPTYQMA